MELFCIFSAPGDGNGGSGSTQVWPFDLGACTNLCFCAQAPGPRPGGRQWLEHAADGSSRALRQREDPAGSSGLLCFPRLSMVNSSSWDGAEAEPPQPSPHYTSLRLCISLQGVVVMWTDLVLMVRKRKRYGRPSDNLAQGSWLPSPLPRPGSAGTPDSAILLFCSLRHRRFVSACVSLPFFGKKKQSNAFSKVIEGVALFSRRCIFYVKR